MKKARSMLLNEEFTSDDNRLTYQSYEKLALICNVCGELVFFKQGIERVSHFSHYKDTGKNKCRWRTKSHDSTQNTDSEAKKQSLEKFQKKLQDIIDEGIIKYQKISFSQLDDGRHQRRILVARRDKGKSLVNQYKIDINSWLSRFYEEREHIKEFAKSLYHNKLSEIQRLVFSNIVHYLCLPASEDILINILYSVFFLNKEVVLNNDFEELRSKVIEIISFADWEKEYKRAKGLVDTSKFEQNLLTPYVDFREYEIAPITFKGIDHPNVEEKTPKSQIKVERQTPKPIKLENEKVEPRPIALDAAKVVSGKLITKGVIVNTPMIITLEDSGDKWKIDVLPVRTPPYDLAIYLSDKLGIKDLIAYIERVVSELPIDSKESKLLSQLRDDLLTGYKISKAQILASTQVIKGCLDRAIPSHKTLYTDSYYHPYTLGWVEFLEDLETEKLTYTLTVWGSEKDTRQTDVPVVINWLKRIPINLRNHFKDKYPTTKEIEKYLQSKFDFRNCNLVVKEKHQDNIGTFIEVYYQGKLQTRQMLNITTPVTPDRIGGKVPVKIAHTVKPMPPSTFLEVLKCTPAQKHLVKDAIQSINQIVDKFISTNRIRFVGKDKTSMVTSVKDLCGFDSTAKSINQVTKTFKKWITPFTIDSEVDKGKAINLITLQTYDQHDVVDLLESIIRGWKYWDKAKENQIELGGQLIHKSDPGRLMMNVHHLVSDQPHLDTLVWGDLINTFYQLSELPLGFRCENGVVLTPWDLCATRLEKWEHRIKIQLIDILYKDQLVKQTQADKVLKGALKAKNDLLITQSRELVQKAKIGGVESWLQMSIAKLYQALEKSYPTWEKEVSQDVLNHLAALHDALAVCENIN